MKFLSVQLVNFRNISKAKITFGDKNFLIGSNAQGKTNILEALHYFSLGSSFKSKQEQWLIKIDEPFARIDGILNVNGDKQKQVSVILEKDELGVVKTLKLDHRKVNKKEFLGNVLTVLFAPDEISLLRLQPVMRRSLMNDIIVKTHPTYWDDITNYTRALKQRNQLLFLIRQHRADITELEGWDEKLALLGSRIAKSRQNLVEGLNCFVEKFFVQFVGREQKLRLVYHTQVRMIDPQWYMSQLVQNRDSDIIYGHTTFGPHRDDLIFLIDNRDARYIASQGEFRLIILALRLAEGKYLEEILGDSPIYLMDDVFSELDVEKSQRIIALLEGVQSIFTTTDRKLANQNGAQSFLVEAGNVKKMVHELA